MNVWAWQLRPFTPTTTFMSPRTSRLHFMCPPTFATTLIQQTSSLHATLTYPSFFLHSGLILSRNPILTFFKSPRGHPTHTSIRVTRHLTLLASKQSSHPYFTPPVLPIHPAWLLFMRFTAISAPRVSLLEQVTMALTLCSLSTVALLVRRY